MENESPIPGRIPQEDDLVALCRALNTCGARYLIVGGFAVIHHGYLRATEDIDLLLAGDLDNQARVKKSLETTEIAGVPIPFADARLLLRMKQTPSEKDADDCIFLRRKIAETAS